MSGWALADAREREEKYRHRVKLDWGTIQDDRTQLLALVDRLLDYAQHDAGCPPAAGATCDCGLDELLAVMKK